MAQFKVPGAESISGPGSLRTSNVLAVEDTSGIDRGVADLAAGLRSASQSAFAVGQVHKDRQRTVDLTAAEAEWTKGTINIGNEFANDGDYATIETRARARTDELYNRVTSMIRDPDTQAQFATQLDAKRSGFVDGIADYGRGLEQQADQGAFEDALKVNSDLISDPSLDEASRDKVKSDSLQSIEVAQQTGLITPGDATKFRRAYIDGSQEQLAINRVTVDMQIDPQRVITNLGVSASAGGSDVANAALAASGGKLDIPVDVAAEVAAALGDKAFPSDPALAAAYLKDPEVNAKYSAVVMTELTDRFDGDMTAAVIAAAPGGGLAMAERWVKSGHKEAVLPEGVRTYYRDVMGRMTAEVGQTPLPVIAAGDVDLTNVEVAVLDRYEQLQTMFGEQMPIISGYRDPDHNKAVGGAKGSQHIDRRAIDVDVSSLSVDERKRFLEMASGLGFTGIGVYKNSIHLDTGARRAWGPSYHADSVPGWAKDVIDQHTAGAIVGVTPNTKGLAPQYAGLTYDQRIKLTEQAKTAYEQQGMNLKAGIQVAVENAPAAIMQGGTYAGEMPTADDFVGAYGAAEGIDKFKTFDASVKVAETAYSMRTMSAEDIAAAVEAAVPKSAGDMAAIEGKKFDAISAAAAATMDARKKDPASYSMQVFPNVAEAWQDIQDAPALANAITVMAEAQRGLGIADMKLLPAEVATQAAKTFNDATLSQDERMGAITHYVLATGDDSQQEAIFGQLVGAGVPPHTQGAFAALERGDTAAASYLFRAAMIDPSKQPGTLPNNVKAADVTTAIQDLVFDDNAIGSVVYGLSDGLAENFERAQLDGTLIENAAKMRLLDHSATTAEDAVNKTIKDMYGDVKVVTGKAWGGAAGAKIVLPKDEDPAPLYDGFNALLPAVSDAIAASITAGANPNMDPGWAKIFVQGRTNRVNTVLEEGYFSDTKGGYVFVDPKTGQAVPGPDGKDLVFTRAAVLQAGAASRSSANEWQQQQYDNPDPLAGTLGGN